MRPSRLPSAQPRETLKRPCGRVRDTSPTLVEYRSRPSRGGAAVCGPLTAGLNPPRYGLVPSSVATVMLLPPRIEDPGPLAVSFLPPLTEDLSLLAASGLAAAHRGEAAAGRVDVPPLTEERRGWSCCSHRRSPRSVRWPVLNAAAHRREVAAGLLSARRSPRTSGPLAVLPVPDRRRTGRRPVVFSGDQPAVGRKRLVPSQDQVVRADLATRDLVVAEDTLPSSLTVPLLAPDPLTMQVRPRDGQRQLAVGPQSL